jgi:hypothetical protein
MSQQTFKDSSAADTYSTACTFACYELLLKYLCLQQTLVAPQRLARVR